MLLEEKNEDGRGRIERFYLLDVCRGIAALSVVIWHFQHFYYQPGRGLVAGYLRAAQPFYTILWPFYEYGIFAVQFFFCLSGFIFFGMYLSRIADGQVTARAFSILRFSRLYPLHFLTLLCVAVFQFVFMELNGDYIVYPINDVKHFILNLFFISHWGFQDGFSFNAPIWSVSVEIVAYASFFMFARLKLGKLWHVFLLLGLLHPFAFRNSAFTQVIFCFFAGGATFLIYDSVVTRSSPFSRAIVFVPVLIAIIALALTDSSYLRIAAFLAPSTPAGVSIVRHAILFPSIVLLFALLQRIHPGAGRKMSLLGDLSYSIYLLHFPMQLIVLGSLQSMGIKLDPGPGLLIAFLVALLTLSYFTHSKFEVPAQRVIRDRFIR